MDSDLGLANMSHAGDIFETPALPVRAADWLALLSWPAGYVHMRVEVEIQHTYTTWPRLVCSPSNKSLPSEASR